MTYEFKKIIESVYVYESLVVIACIAKVAISIQFWFSNDA